LLLQRDKFVDQSLVAKNFGQSVRSILFGPYNFIIDLVGWNLLLDYLLKDLDSTTSLLVIGVLGGLLNFFG
jgi:hypothetical protein